MIYKYLTLATILIANVSLALSQVTIGNTEKPVKGALLQLKNIDGITDDGSANSTKGLLLPRVNLTNQTQLYPIFNTDDTDYISNKNNIDTKHIGLLVFNTNEDVNGLCKGIYVWDGVKWNPLNRLSFKLENETTTTLTDRDGNTYDIANFGNAGIWMTQNIRTLTTACGNPIKQNTTTTQYINNVFAYPNNDKNMFDQHPEYGLLYNYAAASHGNTVISSSSEVNNPNQITIQGICPEGWHLPSNYEYNVLFKELFNNREKYSSLVSSSDKWNQAWDDLSDDEDDVTKGNPISFILNSSTSINGNTTYGKSNLSSNNGFNALAIGRYSIASSNTTDDLFGTGTFFHTSSSNIANSQQSIIIRLLSTWGGVNTRYYAKGPRRFSVRCKKN